MVAKAANYLAVRLPAEITLPGKDYPLPTIFQPQVSYQARNVPFPTNTPATSSSNSPIASRSLDTRPLPTPRPLFLRMPLAKLAKDNSKQYAYFVEGVTLLAWDIAWLCKTQGMPGFDSDMDICSLGRNLWNLLLLERSSSPMTTSEPTAKGPNGRQPPPENHPTRFGQLSHGTARYFLNSTDGRNIMKDWHLQSPMRSVNKIRQFLDNELQKAEWELLQEAEWGMGPEDVQESAVLVAERRLHTELTSPARNASAKQSSGPNVSAPQGIDSSVRSVPRSPLQIVNPTTDPSRTSGWMKLRTRPSGQR